MSPKTRIAYDKVHLISRIKGGKKPKLYKSNFKILNFSCKRTAWRQVENHHDNLSPVHQLGVRLQDSYRNRSTKSVGSCMVNVSFITRTKYIIQVILIALFSLREDAFQNSGELDQNMWMIFKSDTKANFHFWSLTIEIQRNIKLRKDSKAVDRLSSARKGVH